jgi:peptidase E
VNSSSIILSSHRFFNLQDKEFNPFFTSHHYPQTSFSYITTISTTTMVSFYAHKTKEAFLTEGYELTILDTAGEQEDCAICTKPIYKNPNAKGMPDRTTRTAALQGKK